jgi:LAS superfamily LD-carboxypeptidase LdcB
VAGFVRDMAKYRDVHAPRQRANQAGYNQVMLDSAELTGRADTHVRVFPELRCALHPETATAVLSMQHAARAAGIELEVASGFRDFERQVGIWNAKYRGERPLLDGEGRAIDRGTLDERTVVDAILIWSALPGTSRHHWGSDFDLIDRAAIPPGYRPQLTVEEFSPGGVFERLSGWLAQNLTKFDFFRPYTTFRGGVRPEPWHISHAPISLPALEDLTVEMLIDAVATSSMHAREQVLTRLPDLYERYVRSVDLPGT